MSYLSFNVKKFVTVFILYVFIFCLYGCGNITNNDDYQMNSENINLEDTSSSHTEEETTEISQIIGTGKISLCKNFCGGHAWASAMINGTPYNHVLINTEGKILTHINIIDVDSSNRLTYSDGYSSIYSTYMDYRVTYENQKSLIKEFYLLDPNGEVSCNIVETTLMHYQYCGYENGLLYLNVYESDMYGISYYLGIFNVDGECIEKVELQNEPNDSFLNGNGIVFIDFSRTNINNLVYNQNTKQLIDIGDSIGVMGYHSKISSNYIWLSGSKAIPVTWLTDQNTFDKNQAKGFPNVPAWGFGETDEDIDVGTDGNYYDYSGNLICESPAFGDLKIIKKSKFNGGYSAVIIQGADGYGYATVINKNGESLYDPVVITDSSGFNNFNQLGTVEFLKGYLYFDDSQTYLDLNGISHSISDLDSETANLLVCGNEDGWKLNSDKNGYYNAYGTETLTEVSLLSSTITIDATQQNN